MRLVRPSLDEIQAVLGRPGQRFSYTEVGATGDVFAPISADLARRYDTATGTAASPVAAFAYGTLGGHAECGEERFVVSQDPADGRVWYEISAFSRPATWATRLGYPLARRLQKRFREASALALAHAVARGNRSV